MFQKLNETAITILGVGNGGHAFAAYAKERGFSVRIWNRSKQTIDMIKNNRVFRQLDYLKGIFQLI